MRKFKYFLKDLNTLCEEIRCEETGTRLIKFTDAADDEKTYIVIVEEVEPLKINEPTYLKIKNILEN